MMKELIYAGTGEPIRKGDKVKVRVWRFFWKAGVVVKVYDPSQPSPPWGGNDFGFGVKLQSGSYLFFGQPGNDVVFMER